jgi:uncharacterized protein (DUF58 family)
MAARSCAALPLTLHRKRLYILPTRYGIVFVLILFGMLLGSVNHTNNLGFLLTFLLSAMAIISMFYTYRNLLGLRIVSIAAAPVFAGDDAVFEFFLDADDRERKAVEFGFAGEDQTTPMDLGAGSGHRVRILCRSSSRGILKPGPAVVSTQYPFGLFRAWARFNSDPQCLVYPRPVLAHAISDQSEVGSKGFKNQSIQGVEDFMGLRLYQPGDSLQHVSWKSYSRGQGLFTKTFSGALGSIMMLDWRRIKETDTEQRLSMLCHGVLKAHQQGEAFGLWIPGTRIAPGKGPMHKRSCLKALALFAPPERK